MGREVLVVYDGPDGQPTRESYTLADFDYQLRENGVAIVTQTNGEKLNPLKENMLWEMLVVLEHMRLDDKVKVAVWTGAGKAFCAGADFGERVPSNLSHLMLILLPLCWKGACAESESAPAGARARSISQKGQGPRRGKPVAESADARVL